MDIPRVLDLYDQQLRRDFRLKEPGVVVEYAEGITRVVGPGAEPHDNCVLYAHGAPGSADALISAQVEYFQRLGHAFEWKHHAHDVPADLPERLAKHGFIAEETEALLVLELPRTLPARALEGIRIERVTEPARLFDINAIKAEVYPVEKPWIAQALGPELAAAPEGLRVYIAYDGPRPVSAGWMRLHEGTAFASLWGGSTLPSHRRRGIYQALVALRAEQARTLGYQYLTVDASPESRPILERLGFRVATLTTPFIWRGSRM
jgi:GNAT superfamily N-acetyltransferase